MLPHVIRFNGAEVGGWYRDLLECTGGSNGFPVRPNRARMAWPISSPTWSATPACAERLSECGVEHNRLPELATEAATQWTGGFNPRKVGEAELLSLYEAAY